MNQESGLQAYNVLCIIPNRTCSADTTTDHSCSSDRRCRSATYGNSAHTRMRLTARRPACRSIDRNGNGNCSLVGVPQCAMNLCVWSRCDFEKWCKCFEKQYQLLGTLTSHKPALTEHGGANNIPPATTQTQVRLSTPTCPRAASQPSSSSTAAGASPRPAPAAAEAAPAAAATGPAPPAGELPPPLLTGRLRAPASSSLVSC